MGLFTRTIPLRPERGELLACSRLLAQAFKRSDGSVEIRLSGLRSGSGLDSATFPAGAACDIGQFVLDRLGDDLFDNLRGNRLTPRTRSGAAVEGVSPPTGINTHPSSADTAPQDAEPGEEAV